MPTNTDLLGEVISWEFKGKNIPFVDITNALNYAGLDRDLAQELAPRNAFSRACRALTEKRLIRKTKEDDDEIEFQFNKEIQNQGAWDFPLETTCILRKTPGLVICSIPALEKEAQLLLDHHVAHRSAADVTRIIQRLYEANADLFAIRPQGGAYFVPIEHQPFVEKTDIFITSLGGKLKRFPVPKGFKTGQAAAKDAIAKGLDDAISELEEALESLNPDTRPSTIERWQEKVDKSQYKVECYSAYLDDRKQVLQQRFEELSVKKQEKIRQILEAKEKEENAEVAA